MDFEFDKEIDVLLRQTARNGDFVSNQPEAHLDADEIAAFAENALPEKTRQTYMRHLADCDKCRKNLSNLILLNAEQESEIVRAEEKQIVSTPVPWYRKLFVSPNLAYALGALVLVFSGIAIFTVLQNGGDSRNSEVSQTYDKQTGGKGMSSDGDALPSESYSSSAASNTASMNTAASNSMSMSNSAAPSAPMSAMNSNMAAATSREAEKDLPAESRADDALTKPAELSRTEDSVLSERSAPKPPPPPAKENSFQVDGETEKQPAQNSVAQKQVESLPGAGIAPPAPKTTMRANNESKKKNEALNDAARLRSVETTSVGGKTFRRENGVSVDSAYRGQATTNISRGTKEYKKLDSGLRGIVENLGGTVIIVWKEKAYRIQ